MGRHPHRIPKLPRPGLRATELAALPFDESVRYAQDCRMDSIREPLPHVRNWLTFIQTSASPMWLVCLGQVVAANRPVARLLHASNIQQVFECGDFLASVPVKYLPLEVDFPRFDGSSVRVQIACWDGGDGLTVFQAVSAPDPNPKNGSDSPHTERFDPAERAMPGSVASALPMIDALNSICKLAEFTTGGRGYCSLLEVLDSSEQLRVASAPSVPGLVGVRISRSSFETGSHALDLSLQITQATDFIHLPIVDVDDAQLGMLVLWMKSAPSEEVEKIRAALEVSANLASIALTHDSLLRRLRHKQERLAAMSRSMPVGLYQVDALGHWTYSNDRHVQMTGLSLEQSDQEGWLQSVHPDDRDMVREVLGAARAAGSEFQAEYRLVQPDSGQQPRWVIAHETHSEKDGYIGTITDITELKRALTAVAEGAERFETLANNISPFCWMADSTGWIFWYSNRWYEYTGTTFEQLQGTGWRAVHHPDHVDRVVEKLSRHWQTGETWEDTFPLRDKHGNYCWFLSRALAIRDSAGRIVRWFGTNTDVTELRQLEAALHRQNLALQRSNEDLSRFAFFASHDLQEPLRMITSYSQLIQRSAGDRLDQKSSLYLDRILEGAARMGRLIRDLLAYAHASADNDQEPAMFSLSRLVPAVIVNLNALIEEAGASIAIEDLPEVCAIETQISQVLENLLSNALKYRNHDVPLTIRIWAAQQDSSWRIFVRDNGQGFEPEHSTRIFAFLQRLHGKDVPGSGIGLAICKTIVERNRGTIGADGKPSEGATFWFTLPASCT